LLPQRLQVVAHLILVGTKARGDLLARECALCKQAKDLTLHSGSLLPEASRPDTGNTALTLIAGSKQSVLSGGEVSPPRERTLLALGRAAL
jgi:hypothetical protein